VTRITEGFSHFVTSIAAPVASGWSGCRVGLAPTGKRHLFTAHTQRGPWTEQHVDGSFQGTTAIHIFEPVGKFSADVVVGPSTSQGAM
jgi:hypothetical protein